jgi:uncharacterized metal-binding protein
MTEETHRVLVLPCSGVGKVHGLLGREAAYLAAEELAPERLEVVCLALLVKGDEETVAKVQTRPCIAIDGCGKACAQKNVEFAGGEVVAAMQVARALGNHRGCRPGTGSELTEEGWTVAREIAEAVAAEAVSVEAAAADEPAGVGGATVACGEEVS